MTTILLFNVVMSAFIHQGQGVMNFALNKSANQSTTLNYRGFDWTADKAVDGNSNGSSPDVSRTCSATIRTTSVENHIWEVDMGAHIIVNRITVYGRHDIEENQLEGVMLYIGNTSGSWNYGQVLRRDPSSNTKDMKYVYKPHNVIARFISLKRLGTILTICEVTVEGECRRGTYGPGCNEICGNCFKGNNSCSLTDGRCMEGCEAGWRGDTCKLKCEAGTYGFNCNETCGYCLNGNNSCSHMNGQCSGGCQTGWMGETSCIRGTYGSGCNETCGSCYNGNISCLLTDGRCTEGCTVGWHGGICKLKCETGSYGFNCNETCGYCLNDGNNCSDINGQCSGGCQAGWTGETCKSECRRGTYGSRCTESCGNCYKGNFSCSMTDGRCKEGCEAGWHGDICKLKCEAGTYGFNCNETCGYCLNGMQNCSEINGLCSGGCQSGWTGETCQSGMLETITPVDVGPNTGAIVGSVLAAVGVSISAMVIIIVIVKKRKQYNNETSTDNVTTAAHYANVVVGNPVIKITACSREEREAAFSAIEDAGLQKGMPIGVTNSHNGVMKPDIPVHNTYEKLRDVTESTESPYSTIDHNLLHDQKMNTIENCSNYIETLQELESALKSVEAEISGLRDRKEELLCKELESSRAIKFRDKRKETDSTQFDTDKNSTYVNDESRDALEGCTNFFQMLQSLEGELRMLVEKRKCLFERKETLMRQNFRKHIKYEKAGHSL